VPRRKSVLSEYAPIFGIVIILSIIIFLVVVRNDLPNYGNWTTITRYLIGTLPFIFLLFLGFYVVAKERGLFIIAGFGVIGISFALLIGQLNSLGLIDITKSVMQVFGSIEALMTIIIIVSLIIGIILSSFRR